MNAKAANKKEPLEKWGLAKLIDVAVELQILTGWLKAIPVTIKRYRNLVHPGRELRDDLEFDVSQASFAYETLKWLQRRKGL